MNKSGYVEKKWHACNPLSIAEISQEIQHDRIFRRDNRIKHVILLKSLHMERIDLFGKQREFLGMG